MLGENWKTQLKLKEAIIPNGSPVCGNHVAGRSFSDTHERLDFIKI